MRRSKLRRTTIPQRLVRPTGVVPDEPSSEALLRVCKIVELMLPDTFLLETAEEAFDDAILLGRIRRDELLLQPIVSTGLARLSATLENQPVIAT